MDFKTSITWTGKIYKFLEKFNLDSNIALDSFIDNNYPQFLSQLQTYSKEEKIAICATNGKKTTLDLFNQILEANNKTTITNVSKNAKIYPVFTSIILDLAKSFKTNAEISSKDYYTMAFDEFELSNYFNSMKFDYLLLHNIFNDQKDFSSLEEKRRRIQDAIVLNSKLNLIINADEPMFYKIDEIKNDIILNKKRSKIYYGFNNIEFCDDGIDLLQNCDLTKCPICGCKLDYKKRFYSHIGHYDCECGFKRPKLDISADAKVFGDYTFLTVFWEDKKYVFRLPFGGVYNAYNALGAIALAICLNIDRKTITQTFDNYTYLKARDEIIKYQNKTTKIKIIKNPTSLSEAMRELYGSKNIKAVFCLDNQYIDGIDTSWIWDSNFSSVQGFENKIFVCANRIDDMALRLKYSNVNPCLIVMDASLTNAIQCCFYELEPRETMLILTVPSLVGEVYNALKK